MELVEKSKVNIKLFNKTFSVTVSYSGYDNNITPKQEEVFALFLSKQKTIITKVESLIKSESSKQRCKPIDFVPNCLAIEKNGRVGIRFNVPYDYEHGESIEVLPSVKMAGADGFL